MGPGRSLSPPRGCTAPAAPPRPGPAARLTGTDSEPQSGNDNLALPPRTMNTVKARSSLRQAAARPTVPVGDGPGAGPARAGPLRPPSSRLGVNDSCHSHDASD